MKEDTLKMGDIVFFLEGRKVSQGEITGIQMTFDGELEYSTETVWQSASRGATITHKYFRRYNFFSSKEDLIASL